MDFYEACGWIGTILLVLAFMLTSWKLMKPDRCYQLMNIIGATGLGLSAWQTNNRPTIVLEVIWALIAIVALLKKSKNPPPA